MNEQRTARVARADRQKTVRAARADEQKTVRAARADEQKTNKRRRENEGKTIDEWLYIGSTSALHRLISEEKTKKRRRKPPPIHILFVHIPSCEPSLAISKGGTVAKIRRS
ncbi:hypothetical protein [Capnocytophaga sp. HP1101]